MKTMFIALFSAVLLLSACGGGEKQEDTTQQENVQEETMQAASFYCPMKCEGEKTYAEMGSCPVCGMDLVQVETEETGHEGHDHGDGEEHAH